MLGTLVLSTVYVFSLFTPSCFSTFPLPHVFDPPDHPYTPHPTPTTLGPLPFRSLALSFPPARSRLLSLANSQLAWSPDSRFLAVGGQDDLITLFSPREARVVARCQGHSAFVTSIAFDPGRGEGRGYRFASVGEDGKLILVSVSRAQTRAYREREEKRERMRVELGANMRTEVGTSLSVKMG
jgi:WD40 repeat protein